MDDKVRNSLLFPFVIPLANFQHIYHNQNYYPGSSRKIGNDITTPVTVSTTIISNNFHQKFSHILPENYQEPKVENLGLNRYECNNNYLNIQSRQSSQEPYLNSTNLNNVCYNKINNNVINDIFWPAKPKQSSTSPKPIDLSTKSKYVEMRAKNNESAKKSREKRKNKEDNAANELLRILEMFHKKQALLNCLKTENDLLEKQRQKDQI